MKLPSLTNLLNQAKETFARFPLAIISSILGAYVMIRILGFSPDFHKRHSNFWYNLAMTFSLALPLFIATSLFAGIKRNEICLQIYLPSVSDWDSVIILFYIIC